MSAAERPLVVWEDEYLAVVDKPAGLLVHPAPGNPGRSLVEALGGLLGGGEDPARPGIVHRLDRDTSGLLVVAREPAAHKALSAMIAAREVTRQYLALVEGCPQSRTGKIDAPLGRDHRSPERVVVGGRRPRPAVTHFEVRERLPREALLDIRLETGRTHQIRAHLQAIGNPVVGDPQYGSGRRYGLERQFLHSRRLAFEHPMGKGPLEFESELPADLAGRSSRLGGPDPAHGGRPRHLDSPLHTAVAERSRALPGHDSRVPATPQRPESHRTKGIQ